MLYKWLYGELTFSDVLNFKVLYQTCTDVGELKLCFIEVLNYAPNYENFHLEIETLKSIFKHNNYPKNFGNQFITKFLNKLFIKKDLNFLVPKRELTFVVTYLGKLSFDLRTRLTRTIERTLPYCKVKTIFRFKCRLTYYFELKIHLRKNIVIRKVTATLLIMEKYCATFIPAWLNMGICNLTAKRFKNIK